MSHTILEGLASAPSPPDVVECPGGWLLPSGFDITTTVLWSLLTADDTTRAVLYSIVQNSTLHLRVRDEDAVEQTDTTHWLPGRFV